MLAWQLRCTWIKLHLTASGVSLRRDREVAALVLVFRAAADAKLTTMLHLRTKSVD